MSTLPDLATAQRALLDAVIPDATSRRIAWSQGETQVIEAGDGPPLLFVHGGFSQATEWIPLWPHLAHRYRLIAVDRPGHGLAEPFDYGGVDIRDHSARFLADILDALALEQAPIIGNSMGGRWALELALRQPQRVSRLILPGAPAGSKAQVPRFLLALRWPITRPLVRRNFRGAHPDGVRSFFGSILVAHPERLSEEFVVAMAAGQRRNYQSLLSFAKRILTYRSVAPELLMASHWKALQVPVHFVWGEADAFDAPATGHAAVAQMQGAADITTIPDAGHLPWLDEPELVARAIEKALASA